MYSHASVIEYLPVDIDTDLRVEPIPDIETFYPSKQEEFYTAVFDQMVALYRTADQIDQVKAVIFDLDNTLWRGQIAEHYRPDQFHRLERDGWPMRLWETIHHLRARHSGRDLFKKRPADGAGQLGHRGGPAVRETQRFCLG